ncbi:uncharacterized protein [Panulirus ornatus]|uniref:uncharacterized protein n=1 Tax=Panulirus ornatus TaxID=150431 RepID=UPI003A8BAA8C
MTQHHLSKHLVKAIAAVIAAHAPFTPASNIRDSLGLQCTPQTVRNRHHSEGLRGRIPATKPVLSEANMESRVEYALEYADKPHQFWENVIFCDEKTSAAMVSLQQQTCLAAS